MNTMDYLLGFDIGGTKCAVILGSAVGDAISIIERVAFATETARGPEYALTRLEEIAREMCQRHEVPLSAVRGLGISCGGPLSSRRGVILSPPNLPGWDDIYITERFQTRLGIPTFVQNDANACALAEWRWGAGRGSQNMIFLTFGTGMGAGLILDGHLYLGTCELAGEVGHLRLAEDGPVGFGKAGSFEGFCSGGGIAQAARATVRRYRELGQAVAFYPDEDLSGLNAQLVATAANAGDPVAREIITTTAQYLGRGLALLIDILNPEVIVIGSIFARQRDLLWPLTEPVIRDEALAQSVGCCRVVPAALGEAIGDYAALSVAL